MVGLKMVFECEWCKFVFDYRISKNIQKRLKLRLMMANVAVLTLH